MEESKLAEEALHEVMGAFIGERGVSETVSNLAFAIKDELGKAIKETYTLSNGDLVYKKGTLEKVVFEGRTFIIGWQYYDFETEESAARYANGIPPSSCTADSGNVCRLELAIVAVGGKFCLAKAMKGIQDSIAKLWGKPKPRLPKKNVALDKYGRMTLHGKHKYRHAVSLILYLSQKYEGVSFDYKTYSCIMSHNIPELSWLGIRETSLFKKLVELKKSIALLQGLGKPYKEPSIANVLSNLKGIFGIDFNGLIKIGEKASENIVRILARSLLKAKEEVFHIT